MRAGAGGRGPRPRGGRLAPDGAAWGRDTTVSLPATVYSLLGLAVLLACLAASATGLLAAWAWRHHRRRFMLCVFCSAAVLTSAALGGAELLADGAPGRAAWLRLLPDAALSLLFIALVRNLQRQDTARQKAAVTAPINPGTGLPNRAALYNLVTPALARCRRENVPCAVIVAALDGTDRIEAERGPAAAAELLRDFATVFRDAMRAGDMAGHVGHDVLAAMLPGTMAEPARALATRLREQIAARLVHPSMEGRTITASIGIAPIGPGPLSLALDEAFAAGVAALQEARRDGGDGVRLAGVQAPSAPAA